MSVRIRVREVLAAATLVAGVGAVAPDMAGAQATAARDLPRGAILTPDDIVWAGDSGAVGARSDSVGEGWITRRVIPAGEPLRAPAVAPPSWVNRGEPVHVLYRVGSAEARIRGTAMGTAVEGERVLVRIDARRRVEGVVVAPGLVHIQGGIR